MTFDAEGYSGNRAGPSGFREAPGATEQASATSAAGRLKSGPARPPFDAEGVRAKMESAIASAGPWFWLRTDLAAALDRITELEAALAAAEGARLAAERGLVQVGVRYCVVHDGIANEDDGDVCDFARPDRAFTVEREVTCDFHVLGYAPLASALGGAE